MLFGVIDKCALNFSRLDPWDAAIVVSGVIAGGGGASVHLTLVDNAMT